MTLFRWLTTAALLLCLVVVVVGAYVRLSDAGLGCPDWPGCYGQLSVPATAAPGYERPLEPAKAWKEMHHRYLASSLGVLIVLMALVSKFSSHQDMPRRLPWVLVALVIFQGLLGMWTVTLLLKPLVVTAHLLGGMSTLALLCWLWWRLPAKQAEEEPAPTREFRNERQAWKAMQEESPPPAPQPRGIRFWSVLALLLLAAQIFLGGWVSSNYAALACPDLPTCHGKMWPELDLKEAFTLWRGLGVNYEYGVLDNRARVTIHHLHRVGALIVSTFVFVLAWALWRFGSVWKRLGAALWAALAVQVSIGLGLVLFQLPLVLAAAHNAGAALLLLTVITLVHFAWRRPA
jgi:cytochrome c oxidase assembly protein subunit 15